MMNELQAKLKKRQIASGCIEEQTQPQPVKNKTQTTAQNAEFLQKKKNLEKFFMNMNAPQTKAQQKPIPRQEIKGNQQQFNNAKKMLEANFGKIGGGSSSNNSSKPSGGGGLNLPDLPPPPPPPPSTDLLPPPPPPPPMGFQSSQSSLPSAPRLSAVLGLSSNSKPSQPSVNITSKKNTQLPPPPPINNISNLPPPPPPLLPPPIMNPPQSQSIKQSNNYNYANSNTSLSPPPQQYSSIQKTQSRQRPSPSQQQVNVPTNDRRHQPIFSKTEQKYTSSQSISQNQQYANPYDNPYAKQSNISGYQNQGYSSSNKQQVHPYIAQGQNDYQVKSSQNQRQYQQVPQSQYKQAPQQPPQYQQVPSQQQQYQQYRTPPKNSQPQYQQHQMQPQYNQPQYQQSQLQQVQPLYQQQPKQNAKPLSSNNQSSQGSGSRSKPINFHQSQPNISAQILGKDIAGFIKKQFIRQADILSAIGVRLQPKKVFNYNFPSIENQVRNIEAYETIYVDGSILDPAPCFMSNNANSIKSHKQSRQKFLIELKNGYNWQRDQLGLKQAKKKASTIPMANKYNELNFVSIRNGLARCQQLIKNGQRTQEFQKCARVKKIKDQMVELVKNYTLDPDQYYGALNQIEVKCKQIKQIK